MIPGIDVSKHQGNINWKKVAAAGIKFAVIRATVGDYYSDPLFGYNFDFVQAEGILATAYHVIVPNNSALGQIKRFRTVLGNRRWNIPLVFDIELDRGVDKIGVAENIKGCLKHLAPDIPLFYTSQGFWNGEVDLSETYHWGDYGLWVANYYVNTPALPASWKQWVFWQHTDKGKVDGIAGNVDLDWFNGTLWELNTLDSKLPAAPTLEERVGDLENRVSVLEAK